MIRKLLNLLYEALEKMLGHKEASDIGTSAISDEMSNAIELWRDIYKDESPWLDDEKGIYSLGLGKQICQSIQQQVLSEIETSIIEPGKEDTVDTDKQEEDDKTMAGYLNKTYQTRLVKNLPVALEKALALGGMIIKPYINNGQMYLDFNYQGDFYPIAFDDDGNIIDIAFHDSFVSGDYIYTKVERQTFNQTLREVTVQNKAFKARYRDVDDDTPQELGVEIPLSEIDRWSSISEEPITLDKTDKPLYGFFKVPFSNNVDMNSPLGISIFSPAVKMIERADRQFSRLDWEYNGGQLAIDVDPTATCVQSGYYGNMVQLDECQSRLYRNLDLGEGDTYKEWTPALRDANYTNGLNAYLNKIEDLIGLARGTLSQVESEARTATEIKLLKQRTYITVSTIQDTLGQCMMDVVYAMSIFCKLYNLAPLGDYDTKIEWKDSILTDTDTELTQKLNLLNAGILDKAEVRAWYTGETIESAQLKIDEMTEKNQQNMLNDLFSQKDDDTSLEDGGNKPTNDDKNNKNGNDGQNQPTNEDEE